VHHRNRVRTAKLQHAGSHRIEKIAVVAAIHQVSDYFGIGLAAKHIAFGL
jgi:hypothetical protein